MALDGLKDALKQRKTILEIVPLTFNIALKMQSIERAIVPDMPDRIIAATALQYDLPLLTRDSKIEKSAARVVW